MIFAFDHESITKYVDPWTSTCLQIKEEPIKFQHGVTVL